MSSPTETTSAAPAELVTHSLRVNALARFISNGAVVVTGLASATITARWLGPAGKGTLSTMLYIATISSLAATLGSGEAATVLAAGRREKLQDLISLSLPLMLVASSAGIAIVLAAATMANWGGIAFAVTMTCLLVPVRAFSLSLINFQNAMERLVRSSLIGVIQVMTELVLLIAFVIVLQLGIAGGILAATGAGALAIGLSVKSLARDGVRLSREWSLTRARPLLALGGTMITAYVLLALAQRFDLILVYALLGEAPAGYYAVALTLGQLAAYASSSLAMAAFPRLARLEGLDAWALIPRLCRMSLSSAVISGLLLMITTPFLIPTLFGASFVPAIGPTLVLIIGGIVWSELAILTRSVAGIGRPKAQLIAFLAYIIVMVGLDVILIPSIGISGAAIASLVATSLVLIGLFAWYCSLPQSQPLRTFIPHKEDAVELMHFTMDVAGRGKELILNPRGAWVK